MGGQNTEPHLDALAAIPLEERYVWRVISALKWAFCDLDTDSATADLHTLSEEDLKKVVEPLTLRAIQFCLFVNALLGESATERIMQHAVRCAGESSSAAGRPGLSSLRGISLYLPSVVAKEGANGKPTCSAPWLMASRSLSSTHNSTYLLPFA